MVINSSMEQFDLRLRSERVERPRLEAIGTTPVGEWREAGPGLSTRASYPVAVKAGVVELMMGQEDRHEHLVAVAKARFEQLMPDLCLLLGPESAGELLLALGVTVSEAAIGRDALRHRLHSMADDLEALNFPHTGIGHA
jgi:hypothetical protein